jgi:multiple sugar transport system ATP-binding protein
MNFIQGEATGDKEISLPGGLQLQVPGMLETSLSQKMTVGIRPEHLLFSHDKGDWQGAIVLEEQLGSDAFLYVEVPEIGLVTVRAVDERNYHGGETIYLLLPPERCLVFDENGKRLN